MKVNKKSMMITSLVILLPILIGCIFYASLPQSIATHFDANNVPNRYDSKNVVVFGLPLLMLAIHIFGLTVSKKDLSKTSAIWNAIILWIVPVLSNFVMVLIYAKALGYNVDTATYATIFTAFVFMIFGNYMPKLKRNGTSGIRTKWSLESDSCWYKTHRFSGKLWMICGLFILVSVWMEEYRMIVMLGAAIIASLGSILYSYLVREK